MAILGRRRSGVIVTSVTKKRSGYSEAEIFRHIEGRSGEYDDFERVALPDPYADGWQVRIAGKPLESLKMEIAKTRLKTRQERFKLMRIGWRDADSYLKRMEANKR